MTPTATHNQQTEDGRARRSAAPRGEQGAWEPASDRPDPLTLLEEQDRSRRADLVPIRHGRMAVSAFAFYRGAAAIMASDLATTPRSGLEVQACGDAHLSNFGIFASPERRLLFDVNDFDETLRGPWEWDLKRLAASAAVAAEELGAPRRFVQDIVESCAATYRSAMHAFADTDPLEVWYTRLTAPAIAAAMSRVSRSARRQTRAGIAHARTRTSLQALKKLAIRDGNQIRFASDPPVLVPVHDLLEGSDAARAAEEVRQFYKGYQDSLSDDHQFLLSRYEMVDIAHKIVGVGSVGTRALVLLLLDRVGGQPLLLQCKEATASVLEAHLAPSPYRSSAQRVVNGQRMMQAASDMFLGWSISPRDQRDYYWRQLRDMKGSADIESMTSSALEIHVQLCAWTLARAHARSGNSVAIAAYVGKKPVFDRAIARFARAYARQNALDFEAHKQAIAEGRIEAKTGI